MRKIVYLWLLCSLSLNLVMGQCDSILIDIVDDFDSTRLISSKPCNIGYMVPSQFETLDGFKLIEEGKIMITFTQNDTLNAFFMTIAVQERGYKKVDPEEKVLLALTNETVIGLWDIPDKGVFDRSTNMRRYQHVCVIPYDQLFNLSYNGIKKIRIPYKEGYQHDIVITPEQQENIKQHILCIAERLNILPVKP